MISRDEMSAQVEGIIEAGNKLRHYSELPDLAVANDGASPQLLQKLQAKLGKLPPSYVQFLSLFDGISNFEWTDVAMLSAQYLIDNDDLDEAWVDSGAYQDGELLIFGDSDMDSHSVAFLRKTADADGEMKVVNFDSGGPLSEHDNFESYLKERLEWFQESLATEKADRDALSDDE